jgi:hypothetical protein
LTNGVGSLIDGTDFSGIDNEGTISTLNNGGLIRGIGKGISNFYVIGNLNNLAGGVISGQDQGITNFIGGTIGTLNNSGEISADFNYGKGIQNFGTITTLNNSSTISTGVLGIGIYNEGTINTLNNSDTISAGLGGVGIDNRSTFTALNNSGRISAGSHQEPLTRSTPQTKQGSVSRTSLRQCASVLC